MVKTKDVNEEGRGGPRQERLEEALESRAERSGSGVISNTGARIPVGSAKYGRFVGSRGVKVGEWRAVMKTEKHRKGDIKRAEETHRDLLEIIAKFSARVECEWPTMTSQARDE